MRIELPKNKPWKRWLILSLLLLLFCYAAWVLFGNRLIKISSADIKTQTVQSGALDIYTTAYGELVSAKEQLLTAPALGKVVKILIRPGAIVSPDTVILQLSNPELEQQLTVAKGQLAQQKAQREAYKYEQQSARLNYQGNIANIKAEIEKAQLELTVNQDLLNLGVASKIELKRAQLAVKQQQQKLEFEQDKFQQFVEMQRYQLTQRDITVDQQLSQVQLLEQQLEKMYVKSGISGSLQSLEVELGESVQLGQSIAKVGSNKELIAKIRLPQHQADNINLNAPVVINSQKGKMTAHISRIESVVTNGSVLAEATIDGALTSNARPSLSISAQVFVKHQPDTLFIKQTPGFRPRSKQNIYVVNNQLLEQREVILGELTQGNLIIDRGLSAGDTLVLSVVTLAHLKTLPK